VRACADPESEPTPLWRRDPGLNLFAGICKNPHLRPGEVVVDLGCGADIDVILAARRITPGGKVVGVDFAQPMIERATQAITEAGLTDFVQFVVSDLARPHLPDDFADAVIFQLRHQSLSA
jgi:ubiquinone/menaquinone biosynthesis C-methylase UbiE